ncbi:MAG: hypothetical protein RBT25_10205 [Lentisphaeria bacterium]|nr:hypothetical protein [Lentisphaeria bacterium]
MHKKLKVIMLAFMSALLAKAAVTMQTASARIETAGKKLLIKNRLPEPQWSRAELLFSLYEGKEKKTVKMPMPYVSQKDAVMEIEFKGKGWNWQNRVQVKNRLFLIEAKLLNTGKKQLWLEPGLRVIPQFSQSPTEFWDGSGKIRAVGDEELERNGAYSRTGSQITAPGKRGYGSEAFPAAAIIGGDQALFLGYVPFDPVSYSATSWKPEGGVFSYSQRIVADPGQHVEFRQVLGVAAVAFGGAEGVIQQYYDSFPECWQLSGEQENPYIWGNHAHYQHWWSSPDAERSRRLRYSIDWSYCPYKRSGDMRMRPELWDYETFNPFDSWPTPKYAGVRSHFPKTNWQEQTALRRERFHKFAGKLGWMFYNSGTASWCEYQLAEERYADAIIQEGGKPVAKNRWSTGHDREYQMFPYHSSFAKASEEDMRFLAADLQLPGFAFDCGSGGSAYRGPNVNKPCPGRAWDEEGVFIDNLVAKNHQADVVRAINPEQPLTIFMNGTLKGDYVMFERPYVNTADYRVMMPLFRWWDGPRPGCVHGHGYLFRDTVPNWRNMSKQEFADLMSRLADYTLLNQFKRKFELFFANSCVNSLFFAKNVAIGLTKSIA